jgi:hypothetical protein
MDNYIGFFGLFIKPSVVTEIAAHATLDPQVF